MPLSALLSLLPEVTDTYEESFNLITSKPPSKDLGFVSRSSRTITIPISPSSEITIRQSPSLLVSQAASTTGAVLWRVSPAFARWALSPGNILFKHGIFGPDVQVLELGAGASALLALALGGTMKRYWASDQEYVLKLMRENLEENRPATRKGKRRQREWDVRAMELDWETDDLESHPEMKRLDGEPLSAVLACDCIYNEALVEPFVETCVEACRLNRAGRQDAEGEGGKNETVVVVAQEIRDPDVFECWLTAFHKHFRVFSVPDTLLSEELRPDSGFAVHLGILRGP